MASGRGAGRGSLLDKLKKIKEVEEAKRLKEEEEEQRCQEEKERLQQEEASRVHTTAPASVGRGRGSLLMKLKSKSDSSSPVESTVASTTASVAASTTASITSTQSVPTPVGRSSLLPSTTTASMTSTQTTSTSSGSGRGSLLTSMRRPGLNVSGETSGVLGRLSSLSLEETRSSITSEPEVVSRQGESGKRINLTANYVRLKLDADRGMYQYEVKFSPDIDSRYIRGKLIKQHLNVIGEVRTFDGVLLNLPKQLPNERIVLESVHPDNETMVTLTFIFKKKQAMKENIAFFNVLINRVLKALKLVRIGRHDYNPSLSRQVPAHKLEVWPGYVTAVNELEGGLLLNLDASHRVMRTTTVRDMIYDLYKKHGVDFKKHVMNEIVGTSVLTRYNNRTYKIDDVDWEKNPTFEFDKNGEMTSLVNYYKIHYNVQVSDLKQPLLVHRSKHKSTTGETIERMTLLVPELCFTAGLTDSIRSDFNITRDLAKITKVNPEQRREAIRLFIKNVNGNEVTKKILSDWGLELENDTADLCGRVLDPEEITFGANAKSRSFNADWGRDAVSKRVLRTPNLNKWAVICTKRNQKNCSDFLETFSGVCRRVGIQISQAQTIYLNSDDTGSYVSAIRQIAKDQPEMIVIIFPTLRQDKYSAVKKVCCVENAIPSQVIIAKTISRSDKIKSVTEKIALQINCKLGGALWALRNPFSTAMVCGVDVFHGGPGTGTKASVAAFISSLDQMLTSWHSRVCLQSPHQELIDLLKQCLASSLNAYLQKNGTYPDKIFIYRDGVGDGQLDQVRNFEVKQYLETCAAINPNYKPQVSVIVVQKRVNTRIFEKKGELGNPPPGTIADELITRRYLYDFYLVPQLVKQGTVTPTHYVVIHDSGDIKTDHMQRFTYKLCHLYYNWPGTIRVPAPCQYAHKLAYLVGQSIKDVPDQRMNNYLYYL